MPITKARGGEEMLGIFKQKPKIEIEVANVHLYSDEAIDRINALVKKIQQEHGGTHTLVVKIKVYG